MRIGILTDSYKPYVSGVSTSISVLVEGLIDEGHEVFIITPKYKGYKEYDKNFGYIKRVAGGITLPKKGTRFLKYIPFVGRYLKKIDELNLDVIHFHSELTMGKLAIKARKKLGIPLVYTVHTMYEEYMHFISKTLAKCFPKTMLKIVKKVMKRHIKNADVTIVPTKKIEDLMLSYNIDAEYHIVPTGLKLEMFKKELYKEEDILDLKKQLGFTNNDFVCVFIGRVSLEKNIDLLINGFKDIDNQNIKLLIVGDGPHLNKIQERVQKENLENKIKFTGLIPWDSIGLYYQIGDIFVNASTSETQGLTYIEALAAGKPLVVKYDLVLENVITDGYNGFFFNETKELTKKIIELYENKNLLNQIKKNTEKSVEIFDQQTYVYKALEVYRRAIDKAK